MVGGSSRLGMDRAGYAAVQANHESEMDALRREKQDVFRRYTSAAAEKCALEQRGWELQEEAENLREKLTKAQLTCERQERRLQATEAASGKENAKLLSVTSPSPTQVPLASPGSGRYGY
ncbi:unnamed protein product, partial [Discosporangium mesarthrocarpum]